MIDKSSIVIIGGANKEYIIKSESDIIHGEKNPVDMEEHYGGSGINYTLRLLHTGFNVFPILSIGDDYIGHEIKQLLLSSSKSKISNNFINQNSFTIKDLPTPKSTIIVEGIHRTILTQRFTKHNLFYRYIKDKISNISNATSLIIGHIRCKKDLNATTLAIEYFKNKNTLIYANFGNTQIQHKYSFWKSYLIHIDFLQLNINEYKKFFETTSLSLIIKQLQQININAIITLENYGLLAIMKDNNQKIFLARSIDLEDKFVDSTGAGDALCAGVVSQLDQKKSFNENEFIKALEIGRSWAIYACTSFGGANNCPDTIEIEQFHNKINKDNEIVIYEGAQIKDLIALIDSKM